MGRERREFIRPTGLRDSNLIVIATEGEKCEPFYFDCLKKSEQFLNPRVHLEIIPSTGGKSSPSYVLNKLNEFRSEFRIREDDELWMVVDRDFKSWTQAELSQCLTKCKQKKYRIGLSNPNFEIWILLHLMCIASRGEDFKNQLRQNIKSGRRTFCEKQIIDKRGHYNKSNPIFTDLLPYTETALERADKLTKNNSVNLFDNIGTNVGVLVRKIIGIK